MSVMNRPYTKKLIKDLCIGDITLHPLYRTDGLLLIDKNRILNEGLIKIIKKACHTLRIGFSCNISRGF